MVHSHTQSVTGDPYIDTYFVFLEMGIPRMVPQPLKSPEVSGEGQRQTLGRLNHTKIVGGEEV